MQFTFNGESRQADSAPTVAQVLEREGLAERRVAVELNGRIVPRSAHAEQHVTQGDRIEVVHALGGG